MDLNSARMFAHVVTNGSFSAAAKAMGVPVATVSRRVAELEKTLDARLLERSTRKLRLTAAGSTLYEYAIRGVEEFDAGLLALTEQQHELKGVLRLSMPPSFEPMWGLLERFQLSYANIELEVMITERRIDFIEDGIDVVLRVGALQTQSAVARKLADYRHKLVAAPTFLELYDIQSPRDLLDAPCVAWGKLGQQIQWCLGEEIIQVSAKLRVNDYLQIRAAVLGGKCISEIPPSFCETFLQSRELVEVLPNYPLPEQTASLLYPSRKHLSRITRAFIDFCVSDDMWKADWITPSLTSRQ